MAERVSPRGGRPREAAKEFAVLEATRALLATKGYAAVSIDAVAQRAGVARTTIYRRWPSKPQMVVAAITEHLGPPPAPDTGTLRADLIAVARETIALFDSREFRIAAPGLVADLSMHAELFDAYQQQIIGARREVLRQILRRGVRRGELRRGADLDLVMDQLTGPLWYRSAVRGGDLRPRLGDQIVDTVLAYYAPGAPGPVTANTRA